MNPLPSDDRRLVISIEYIAKDNDYSFHSNELYKYKVNVLLTIRNGNVLKEQNFTCTLIPCTTLGNLDFMDLVKKKQ